MDTLLILSTFDMDFLCSPSLCTFLTTRFRGFVANFSTSTDTSLICGVSFLSSSGISSLIVYLEQSSGGLICWYK
ncbi:hypothetical protein DPMN_050402 [Dreissena polymorpha]|uniref:Uncharacterized protein n=1 Tax=Dreissena polymorpha TaxID=45954 RepID=A0A9D4CHX9_DREPO|nr:hypothetical protein DPMN_050402 [Dreissena polymorpha]